MFKYFDSICCQCKKGPINILKDNMHLPEKFILKVDRFDYKMATKMCFATGTRQ